MLGVKSSPYKKIGVFKKPKLLIALAILLITLVVSAPFITSALQNLFIGSSKVTDIQIGDTPINYVYKENQLVWSRPKVFEYTGSPQEFIAPMDGYYRVELWGASGSASSYMPGKGSYTRGLIALSKDTALYVYVGGVPTSYIGGYNGGGSAGHTSGYGGGGATDIRLSSGVWNDMSSLRLRVMIAGGGSSNGNERFASNTYGGDGGGLFGLDGVVADQIGVGGGGAQSLGGAGGVWSNNAGSDGKAGFFGVGGVGSSSTISRSGAGGGGGYYGGGGGGGCSGTCSFPGGGGSSYISGYAGVNSVLELGGTAAQPLHSNNTLHYSGKYFINSQMQAGVNTGNGKAKITYLGTNKPQRTNTKLDSVRYIKDCVTPRGVGDPHAHWRQIQAIKDGVNIAKDKTVTGTFTPITGGDPWQKGFSRITDGAIDSGYYVINPATTIEQCVTVDLGSAYILDEVAVWHYWEDAGRIYKTHTMDISADGLNWTSIPMPSSAETSQGKRYSAYE